jgi:hypothetical protein
MAFHVCNEQRETKLREEAILKGRKEQLEQLQMMRDRDVVIPSGDNKHYKNVTLHHPKAQPAGISTGLVEGQSRSKDEVESDHYFIDKVRTKVKSGSGSSSGGDNHHVRSHSIAEVGESITL